MHKSSNFNFYHLEDFYQWNINSIERIGLKYFSLVISLLGTSIALCIIVFAQGDVLLKVGIFLFLIIYSFYFYFVRGYFWLAIGLEIIEFRFLENKAIFYRKDLWSFERSETTIDLFLSGLGKSHDYSSAARGRIAYGYAGGKLKIEISNKYIDFGASLSKEDSQELLTQITRVAKERKQ